MPPANRRLEAPLLYPALARGGEHAVLEIGSAAAREVIHHKLAPPVAGELIREVVPPASPRLPSSAPIFCRPQARRTRGCAAGEAAAPLARSRASAADQPAVSELRPILAPLASTLPQGRTASEPIDAQSWPCAPLARPP